MTDAGTHCACCKLPKGRIWDKTETAIACPDGFPVSEGHTLVIPKRHVAIPS